MYCYHAIYKAAEMITDLNKEFSAGQRKQMHISVYKQQEVCFTGYLAAALDGQQGV